MEQALSEFRAKIKTATGREALDREIADFHRQVESAIAHQQPHFVEFGLCDFQTLSGRAELVRVQF